MIYRGLVFVSIQPMCLLVGAFNTFTFKVTIDMYETSLVAQTVKRLPTV